MKHGDVGDSRGILFGDDDKVEVTALSYDHKPSLVIKINRLMERV